jgi:hypothetical protein
VRRISRDPHDVQAARDSIANAVADTVYAAAMVRAIGCHKQANKLEKTAQKVAAALGDTPSIPDTPPLPRFDRTDPAAWIAVGGSVKKARGSCMDLCTPLCNVASVRVFDRLNGKAMNMNEGLENEMFKCIGNGRIDDLILNPLWVFYGGGDATLR